MAASELETVEDDGFVFKVRKQRLGEIQAAAVVDGGGGAPREQPSSVAVMQSIEVEMRTKKLQTLKAMYEAELQAWEKLEAAATAPDFGEPPLNSDTSLPERDPHAEALKQLKIEVENVEEYIKCLQDHIVVAESTYKLVVKEIREDANFRPADEIVLALTGQGGGASSTTPETDPTATQGSTNPS